MRYVLVVLLALIFAVGIGFGFKLLVSPSALDAGIAYLLILVGTVALSGVTIVAFIEAGNNAVAAALKDSIAATRESVRLLDLINRRDQKDAERSGHGV